MSMLRRKLTRDVWHYRGQIASVALVMASGIALFVALRSMHGYLLDSQTDYYRAGRFADAFVSLRRAPLPVADRVAALPGVTAVEHRIVADVLLDVPGATELVTGRFVSVPDRERSMLNGLVMQRGHYPSPVRRDEIVVSSAFARAHRLDVGDAIGAIINGRRQDFRIVGLGLSPEFVYEIRGGIDVFPDSRRFGVMWATRGTLAAAFDLEGGFNDLAIAVAPDASLRDVIERADRIVERYGGLGAYGREDHVSHRFVTDEIAETRVTSILIPSIFLGVTAFLLHTVLLRLVGVEREQIALLRAFGFTPIRIAAHYLAFASAPVVAGAALGTVTGLWFAHRLAGVYARFFQFPFAQFTPDPWIVATALLVSAAAVFVGSAGAVRAVLRLPPAEAMRPPAPPAFRRGLASRVGIERHVSPEARMVLRSLERRPGKASMSIAGIALALAMVVTGRYAFDAIDLLKRVQFYDVDRWTSSVVFNEPRSSRVRHEIARLDGVERVEMFRAVPVRLTLGHLEQTTAILGLQGDAALRRIVDHKSRVALPPENGILLTRSLASQLTARPGDVVTIEVLEGDRRVVTAPVAGTVDELVGASAYMELEALHRLVHGERQVNGAFLRVAEADRARVRERLSEMPVVSGVAERSAVLVSFERTVQESFRISLTIVLGFAVLIASGIVYNSGRIALSERARELASLRVLGFTRRETASMLLGEQLAIVVAAIPAGWLCGYALCALINHRAASETFRLPLAVSSQTYATATVVVLIALAFTAATLRRRVDRLDLVNVLKARE
jgi:putative ABC transport system permease protein